MTPSARRALAAGLLLLGVAGCGDNRAERAATGALGGAAVGGVAGGPVGILVGGAAGAGVGASLPRGADKMIGLAGAGAK